MAMINQLDPATTTEKLKGWLEDRLPDAAAVDVTDLEIPASAGLSMTTVLFRATWRAGSDTVRRDLAARVVPVTGGLFRSPDLEKEFTLIRTLAEHTRIPVARALWLENDPSVLGSPFMVSDLVPGRVAPDDPPYTVAGWVLDLAPERRGHLYWEASQILSQIQAVDWRGLGLGFWEDTYRWATGKQSVSPTIEAALDCAKDARPVGEDLVLNWGDPRIGNILYANDLSVNGILDWEMATIASPEYDLGWYLFIVRYYTEGLGVPQPEGLPSKADLIADWESATGRTAQHVAFYEAFAALRLSILMVRVGTIMIEAGAVPDDSRMAVSNPASQLLAKLAPVPAPDSLAVDFYGKR